MTSSGTSACVCHLSRLSLQALAHEAKACFLLIQQSDLGSKWYGDSARLAAAVFSLALKLAPCIVFLGEPTLSSMQPC